MKRFGWLLVLLCTFSLLAGPASAEGQGIIQGRVTNGTADGGSIAGLEVVLLGFQGQEQTDRQVTTVDAQEQFRFEGLQVGDDWAYLVRVSYNEVAYSSGLLAFQDGQTELQSEVVVYETMTDDTSMRIERAHFFVSLLDGGLEVTEMYVFDNPTDRTYVGKDEIDGRRWTSRYLLPRAARDLALDDGTLGGRFLLAEDGFVDTEPQWPGGTSVMYTFALDCPGGTCDLEREMVHPIVNLNVLIPDVDARIDSKRLAFQGQRDTQDGSYLNYVARDLTPGERLDLRVRLPGAVQAMSSPSSGTTQALPWIILGAVLTALVLVYPFWRRRIEAAARQDG